MDEGIRLFIEIAGGVLFTILAKEYGLSLRVIRTFIEAIEETESKAVKEIVRSKSVERKVDKKLDRYKQETVGH